jgi:tetratricopeptide (TPR) repeat protein
MLCVMTATAVLHELPPVTTLSLVPTHDVEQMLARAEGLVAAHRFADAAVELASIWEDVRNDPPRALRQRLTLAWAELYLGELDEAEELLAHAEAIATSPHFDAADRSEVLYRQGCVTLKQNRVADAATLFTRALDSNDRAPRPRAALASRTHEWRSRCHVRARDWDAARRDVEQAIELALAARDPEAHAHALFQASIVAERQNQWLLARCYAERALALYSDLGNKLCTARVLNNLGGIDFLLGDAEAAEEALLGAIDSASEAASDVDLAQAVNSLARVLLDGGRSAEARARALRAVELLEHRTDFLDELGNAQLVVARSLAADGEPAQAKAWLERAADTCTRLGSSSHLALVLVAQGDLARSSNDADAAADLYRGATELLQDLHF